MEMSKSGSKKLDEGSARPFTLAVEGNIGSGKSTMLNCFQQFADVQLSPEPINQWCDLKGHNLLELLYKDPKRWSFQFQSYVQLTRLQLIREKSAARVRILERSLQNNRYCFLELARKVGSLSEEELAVLHAWHEWLDSSLNLNLDLIVYLKTHPDVAYQRMLARNRSEESSAKLQYLVHLHEAYEDWLISQKFGDLDTPVLVFDANFDLTEMNQRYQEAADIIRGLKRLPKKINYFPECLQEFEDKENIVNNIL